MNDDPARLAEALADRYRIEGEIGSGGMATVYLAEDLRHERKVALKVLRPDLAASLGSERFLQEVRVTANLQHPNILPLFDSGEVDGFLFYVMPFIQGESLRQRLRRERELPVAETARLLRDVVDALAVAHQLGVVHRDIKPENVLLSGRHALVADFGVAKAVSEATGRHKLTTLGVALGTPSYMAPEQAAGESTVDHRADIYAVGAMAYELLTGCPPFTGGTAQQILAAQVLESPQPVTELRASVPPLLGALVMRCLEKKPADRWQSAEEMLPHLEAAITPSGGVTPVDLQPVTRGATPPRSRVRRGVAGLAGVAVVLLVGSLATRAWLGSDTALPVTRSLLAFPSPGSFIPNWGQSIALSPDGTRFAYIGPSEEGTAVWIKDRNALEAYPLRGTEGAFQVLFDPTGQHLAFLTYRQDGRETVRRIPLVGGTPMTLADGSFYGTLSWGEDGYLYAGAGADLHRIPVVPGVPGDTLLRYEDLARYLLNPQTLPGDQGLLFTLTAEFEGWDNAEIAVFDLRNGGHRVLAPGAAAWYAPTGHILVLRADGTLLGAPFDLESLSLQGPLIPVLDHIAVSASNEDLEYGGIDLTFSAEGTLIYMPSGYVDLEFRREVVWVSRTGAASPVDSAWQFRTSANPGLALSPDGSRLAIGLQTESGDDIWIKHLPDGPVTRLTFRPGENRHPRWSRDGNSLVYVSGGWEGSTVFSSRADGVGEPEPVLSRDGYVCCVTVSPASDWLLIRSSSESGSRDLMARRPGEDTVDRPLLMEEFDETAAAISPDGRWLAYQANESGRWEVFVRPFPNVNDGQWQVSSGGGATPVWAHSGRELFYVTPTNEMVAVAVEFGSTFTVGRSQVLFKLGPEYVTNDLGTVTAYDIAPDDQHFLMIRTAGDRSAQPHLVMVDNWFQELREKLGR
jgi:serine/threonine-protein kinase